MSVNVGDKVLLPEYGGTKITFEEKVHTMYTVLFMINWTMSGTPTGSRIVGGQRSVGSHIGANGRSLPSGRKVDRITS